MSFAFEIDFANSLHAIYTDVHFSLDVTNSVLFQPNFSWPFSSILGLYTNLGLDEKLQEIFRIYTF